MTAGAAALRAAGARFHGGIVTGVGGQQARAGTCMKRPHGTDPACRNVRCAPYRCNGRVSGSPHHHVPRELMP